MNEPKKRGRPSKAELAAKQAAADLESGMVVMTSTDEGERLLAQAYAMRVWAGQSDIVPRPEKIRRCEAALIGQNLPTEGVEYPE